MLLILYCCTVYQRTSNRFSRIFQFCCFRFARQLPVGCQRLATKKIRHTTNVTENLSVSVRQMFATVPMWKIRHTTVIGWGLGVANPHDPKPQLPQPHYPTSTLPTPTYHRCMANLPHRHCCKRLSDAYAQILDHICMSHPLCGESFLWQIFCGESSMW